MDKHPHLVELGKKIVELRKAQGYSQENFAIKAKFDRAYYGGIERGDRNISAINLIRLAVALKVEVGDLFPKIAKLKVC